MCAGPAPIRLQILLRPEWRNEAGVRAVSAALRTTGVEVTGSGAATVSCRASPPVFQALFGQPAPAEPPGPPGQESALPVPGPLARYVESISMAPTHEIIGKPHARRKGREGR